MARFNDNDLLLIKKALEYYKNDIDNFTYGATGGCEDRNDAFLLIERNAYETSVSNKEINNMQELDETANKIINAIEKCEKKINKKLDYCFVPKFK